MDYKEKYEMALEGIQEILGSGEDSIKMSRLQLRLQGIFPELKESEDEKIRKVIADIVKAQPSDSLFNGTKEKCLAWLEKQGEQKPAVPKFRIGDKVKKDYLTYTVEDIDEDSYKLQAYSKDGNKGCTVFLTIGYEKDYELVAQKGE